MSDDNRSAETDNRSVVSLFGGPIVDHKGDPSLIALLETLLVAARAGEIIGMFACTIGPDMEDKSLRIYNSTWQGPRLTLLGALTRCSYALNCELDKS